MTCPDTGRWRAWLDGESAGEAGQLDGHLAACRACGRAVAELRQDAELAASKIGALLATALPSPAAVEQARADLHRARPRPAAEPAELAPRTPRENPRMTLADRFHHWRVALGGLAAALALTLVALTPEGRTAAAAFLAQFRSQQIAVVTFDSAARSAFGGLDALDELGAVQGARRGKQVQEVGSVAEASKLVGFAMKAPDQAVLPNGVDKQPEIGVMQAHEVRFTFDRDKTLAYLKRQGHPEIRVPDKLDGASLVVQVPAAVMMSYSGNGKHLMVGEAGQVTAGVDGDISLEELRDFLLSLPGLSPDTQRQLRDIKNWQNTLPIPVPVDKVSWQKTTIAGGDGLVLSENSGLGNAAMFLRDGRVYGVAGTFDRNEILRVANSLP